MSWFDWVHRRRRGMPAHSAPDGDAGQESELHESNGHVAGERGPSAVQRPPALQTRIANLLALALMGGLAIALLGWYYARSVDARSSQREATESSAKEKAKGEMTLRPLGRVDPPPPRVALETLLGAAPEEPPPADESEPWLQSAPYSQTPYAPASGYSPGPVYAPATVPAASTPEELARERKLSGPAFASAIAPAMASASAESDEDRFPHRSGGELDEYLRPSATPAVSAKVLPTQRLLLPKGAFIDCTLETAIDSSLPGMTTCITATDTFSSDGSVVLLERGTKLVGETRGQVRAGSARLFVLWTEARTPTGVVVPLASPGTDELGRSGLPGEVNRHFFERFGAAILISVVDGAVQAAVQAQREEGDTVVVSPSGSSEIMTEILKSTINIPPTIVKPQGDRIQVLVARDLDFRSVYELRPVGIGR